MATDPVCSMTVSDDSRYRRVQGGQTYLFCSQHCFVRFQADPAGYIGSRLPSSTAAPSGTTYTCPMHPLVLQPAPGTCPKCGMVLEAEAI